MNTKPMSYFNYLEKRERGTESYPLEYFLVDRTHSRYCMPHHWHNEIELLRVIKGEFVVLLDGNERHLMEGDLCFIPNGMIHGGEGKDCTYECLNCDISKLLQGPPLIRQYLSKVENNAYRIQNTYTQDHSEVLKCVSEMLDAARNKKKGWEMLVLAGLYEFFGIVIQNGYFEQQSNGNSAKPHIRRITNTIDYITQNYEKDISLQELANTAGLSKQYFCRYFRMVTGKTPIEYLNYYRIERACLVRKYKKMTTMELAMDCGFNDVNNFVRHFKKFKGKTPYQYFKTENKSIGEIALKS